MPIFAFASATISVAVAPIETPLLDNESLAINAGLKLGAKSPAYKNQATQ
jgi:hypothetical protein